VASLTVPPSRKGIERKSHILDTALRIIGRDGLSRLSMRSLATEAGTPLGALGYYFSGKDELIREAFEAHLDRELRRVAQTAEAIETADSAEDMARHLAAFVVEGLTSPDYNLVAEYEFIVESSRRPGLARSSRAWQLSFRGQLENTFARLGAFDPAGDAVLMMAVLAGIEIDRLARRPDASAIAEIHAVLSRVTTLLHSSWAVAPPA